MLENLKSDLKDAMRARDKTRTGTIRMLIASFQNARIAKGSDLTEADITALLSREAKRRREAATAFRDNDRIELADKEDAELLIIQDYLPKQLSEDEVRAIAREVIAAVSPTSLGDTGKVMGQAMPKLKGRFPGKAASGLIRDELKKALA